MTKSQATGHWTLVIGIWSLVRSLSQHVCLPTESLPMPYSRLVRAGLFVAALFAIAVVPTSDVLSQKARKSGRRARPSPSSSRNRGRSGPTCRRANCRSSSSRASGSPSSATRTAERMNLLRPLRDAAPPRGSRTRNSSSATSPGRRTRSASASGRPTTPSSTTRSTPSAPDTFLCFFGFNESFEGPDGVEKFKADYEKFLDEYAAKYPRDDAEVAAAVRARLADRVRADRRPVPARRRQARTRT